VTTRASRGYRPSGSRRSTTGCRLRLFVTVLVLLGAGCGSPDRQILALSDEVASFCGDLAGRMAEGWLAAERNQRRRLAYDAADLGHLDGTRARCAAALELLEELDGERTSPAEDVEANLGDLLTLDRLLLRSIEDPDMESDVFATTHAAFAAAYRRARPRLQSALPLGAGEQQELVGGLIPRWNALIESPDEP